MIRGWDAPHKRNPHFINFLTGVRSVHFVVIFFKFRAVMKVRFLFVADLADSPPFFMDG